MGLVAVPAFYVRHTGLTWRDLYGVFPPREDVVWIASLALPLAGFSLITAYLLFAPLSLLFPDAIDAWLFEATPPLYSAGPPHPILANILSAVVVVIGAPIAEEWFFRGLLFRRWGVKWGAGRGAVASSLLFGLLHPAVIGGFVFGMVACQLYARYRSLWAPTIVHVAGNAFAWSLSVVEA